MPNEKSDRILVANVTAEFTRKADFWDCFMGLQKRDGDLMTGVHGQSPAAGRNEIIKKALELDVDRIMFFDDDTIFSRDLLENLRQHDVDIVTALAVHRNYPHVPLVFDKIRESDGALYPMLLKPEYKGLMRISGAGLGCCLIKTDVFRKLEPPWIRLGELQSDGWCDDIGFFKRCREKEIEIYCDFSQKVGHMASVTLWPELRDGQWFTTYDSYGSGRLSAPAPSE